MGTQSWKLAAGLVGLVVVLSGCGGGGGGGGGDAPASAAGSGSGSGSSGPASVVPPATSVAIGFGTKQLQLSWTAVSGASVYRVLEAVDGSNFVAVGTDLPGTQTSFNRDIAVHQHNWSGARYQVQACNTAGCSTSDAVDAASGVLQAIGYFKASNTDAADNFGWVLALSASGDTLAVGAPGESSASTASPTDNSRAKSGAVYVFVRNNDGWSQQTRLKSRVISAGDTFGESLALSADGNTLVVGAPLEDGAATGVDGNDQLLTANDAGAAYVFFRNGSTWTQQAYIKASNTAADAYFGWSTALSRDGNTLAVGAVGEASGSTGVNSTPTGTAAEAGAVYVYTRAGAAWSQRAYLKASNATAGDNFGTALALNGSSPDALVLAVGAPYRNGDAGAAYVFTGGNSSWTEVKYLTASNMGAGDNFGASLALSGAGNVLAVGAPYEQSAATGTNGAQADNSANLAGAVYVFSAAGTNWTQSAYIKASNTEANDNFGTAVALGSAGDWLAVGAIGESSGATGIGSSQSDNGRDGVGAAYTFALSGSSWSQQAYIKPAFSQAGGEFGSTLSVSADTHTLAIGATFENSAASGIGGDQLSTQAPESGAVWLY